jgi:tRNA (cmo5U34)-methyltransferase
VTEGGAINGAVASFDAHAAEYTALRRRLVPFYDAFYGAAVDALSLMAVPPRRVLDLGAGTGLLSAAVLAAYPDATVELLDASRPMLTEVRDRLGASVTAVHVADMDGQLPDGPFDAVVSALAIHHLDDVAKRRLFTRVREVLAPGGAFVNAEQVAPASDALMPAYWAMWERDCRAAGADDDDLAGARERMRHDRCADVESQLSWLRDAGFPVADCFFKSWRFAVIAAYTEVRR